MKLLHIGVPTKVVQKDEMFLSDMGVYVTDPEKTNYNFEYLRFLDDSWMPREIKEKTHVAIEVNDIDAELSNMDKVLVEKLAVSETCFIAFALKDDTVLELVENK